MVMMMMIMMMMTDLRKGLSYSLTDITTSYKK